MSGEPLRSEAPPSMEVLLAGVPRGRQIVCTDVDGAVLDGAVVEGGGPGEPAALASTGAQLAHGLDALGLLLGAGPLEAAVLSGAEACLYVLPAADGSLLVALGEEVRNPVAALRQAVEQVLVPPPAPADAPAAGPLDPPPGTPS